MNLSEMKKLLILGGNYIECDLIREAKSLGYYVIVTDNHEDWSLSPGKQIADEGWNISWSDIDSLEIKCKEVNVAGVLAGFSEFRVENMIKLCKRLGLPCALTLEQLDVTRDKIKFKACCKSYDIPCVKEYTINENVNFPVIIKPVDRAGSIGINIAKDIHELKRYYQYALSLSPSKNVIIEDYIDDGTKVDVYYFVQNDNIELLGTSDTIMCSGNEGAKFLQKAWTFPSVFERKYVEELDPLMKNMIKGLGISFGYITISLFYFKEHFYVFEAGFRLSGELSYNYYKAISDINYLDLLIHYSVNDPVEDITVKQRKEGFSIIFNYFGRNGKIEKIEGLNNITDQKSVIGCNLYAKEGETIQNETNVLKKIAMITLFSETKSDLYNSSVLLNKQISFTDINKKELIYEYVYPEQLEYLNAKDFVLKNQWIDTKCIIVPKTHFVSYSQIQALLTKAHQTNIKNNLIYATANQSVDTLRVKLTNSLCCIALNSSNEIVATGSIQFRSIDHWYHKGSIGLIKLLAVDPQYRKLNLLNRIVDKIVQYSLEKGIKVLVTDSAEQNIAIKHTFLNFGFKTVDNCLYSANNFYSNVYAKWLDGKCPWSNFYIKVRYYLRRYFNHIKYKPGKIERFQFFK